MDAKAQRRVRWARIGGQVRNARDRSGLSRFQLAVAIGASASAIKKIEQGQRGLPVTLAERMARTFDVDPALLLQLDARITPSGPDVSAVTTALFRYDVHRDHEQLSRSHDWRLLRLAIARAHRHYQSAEYDAAAALVPDLLADAQQACRQATEQQQREAWACLADALHVTAALLIRGGYGTEAWLAADRSVVAAQHSDVQLLDSVSAFRLGHALIAADRPSEAHRIAVGAAGVLGRDDDQRSISLRGSLLLVAALAAAHAGDEREAADLLGAASITAVTLGSDRNDCWTAFGPTNVEIHRVSIHLTRGNPGDALAAAQQIRLDRIAPALRGRRSQHHVNLAEALATVHDDRGAVAHLIAAERIAPQVIQFNRHVRRVIRSLLLREARTATPGLRLLAQRASVLETT